MSSNELDLLRLVAADHSDGYTTAQVAWSLNLSEADAKVQLLTLQRAGLVDEDPEGAIDPVTETVVSTWMVSTVGLAVLEKGATERTYLHPRIKNTVVEWIVGRRSPKHLGASRVHLYARSLQSTYPPGRWDTTASTVDPAAFVR